jgi:hypothetical protein
LSNRKSKGKDVLHVPSSADTPKNEVKFDLNDDVPVDDELSQTDLDTTRNEVIVQVAKGSKRMKPRNFGFASKISGESHWTGKDETSESACDTRNCSSASKGTTLCSSSPQFYAFPSQKVGPS